MDKHSRDRRTTTSRTGAWLAVLLTCFGFASLAPSAASADWDFVSCSAARNATCSTRPIPAHRSEHWVHVTVPEWSEWAVYDLDTGVMVGQGSRIGYNRFIYGLYGERYQLVVRAGNTGAGGWGHLKNCTAGCVNH